MRRITAVLALAALVAPVLLVPASAQVPDRIAVLDNFGQIGPGEPLFIFGEVAALEDGSYLIMQIINPRGDLCQIQQLSPLPSGAFITDTIPLRGGVCGVQGEYEIRLFYGDYAESAAFTLGESAGPSPTPDMRVEMGQELLARHGAAAAGALGSPVGLPDPLPGDLAGLEAAYVDLWAGFYADELVFEVDPGIRPAISSSLDSVAGLLDADEISVDLARSIDRIIFAAAFQYQTGDRAAAVDLLADAFVEIRNADPEKAPAKRAPTFDELEATLLNLMKKTDTVMGKSVKEEVAFIFSRGTGPVHAEEIDGLIDVLSKSRYLDIVSRKQTDLYRFVQGDWESLKSSLQGAESIAELLESRQDVAELHAAAIALRELDDVERFIKSDAEENSDLANLLAPSWGSLARELSLASSVGDILLARDEIHQMAQVIDISARIEKSVEVSQSVGVSPGLTADWRALLERVGEAGTAEEILAIVSAFERSMTELREKRSPLSILEFQYETMRQKAELQADHQNLHKIDSALRIIGDARELEAGNPSVARVDRMEVLLTWASEQAPVIRAELDSYGKDVFKVRAGDILQRAKSAENLVELSLTKKRFLPNYTDFADAMLEKIALVRDLVIRNDLERADELVREVSDEWQLVSRAYDTDPYGSPVGYSVDELKRIELRKNLETFSEMVSAFYNDGFAAHADRYHEMVDDTYELIEIANFIDAERKINEIGEYLSRYMVLANDDIWYEATFEPERDIWVISGANNKSVADRRENIYLTVFNMDGTTHSSLEFTDTRQGNFYTQWEAPTEPGLYVVQLQYQDSKATQIVHVEEEFDTEYDGQDLDMAGLAREFDELESFAERFGGEAFVSHPKFAEAVSDTKDALADRDAAGVDAGLEELKKVIERYLPVRSRQAVIEAQYAGDQLVLSGAVQKSLAFSEDLFVDIYDQRGGHVEEVALRDSPSGSFTEVVPMSMGPGMYVAQLQYHDLTVTDFFSVP